jgi:NADH:ubiquinone oxidoreductase subunit F (NADH-binding)/NAD-dependent dihydropyrimidine dehydrogenase PreA subunit/(2Fe-2S) ferredoxin
MITELELKKAEKLLHGDRITVGCATCGISAGALPVFEALKKADIGHVEEVGCIGMCHNEPIVTVVQDGRKAIYGQVTEKNVHKLIQSIKARKRDDELFVAGDIKELDFYKGQRRLVMGNCGEIQPLKLDQYLAMGGYQALHRATCMSRQDVISEMIESGLRGRGGAGFLTGKKWSFIADKPAPKYLIANGDEGDPGAFMNRTLMESDPFKIIEGMTIGAYATGCEEGFIYTRAEYPLAIKTLQAAIDKAYEHKLLGRNILGKGFNFELSIRKGAGAFVCGEETALIHSIEGKRGSPSPRPPYPADHGVFGKPSCVNNVGTWGHVTVVFMLGSEDYRKIGTKLTSGTKELCLAGLVKRPGIVEVPIGTSLRKIVYDIGGGTSDGSPLKAVLTGGPAGGCIPADKLDVPLDFETLRDLGSIMGSGGIIVLSEKSCIVDVARFYMHFTQEESCGKCTPCREGTKRLLEMLESITSGHADPNVLAKLRLLSGFVIDNALCGLGQNAPNPIISTLKYFEQDYKRHIEEKACPAGACTKLVTFTITGKCVGCGNCKRMCPVKAITGSPKEKHFIDQKACIKCGTCYTVCPVKAIIK